MPLCTQHGLAVWHLQWFDPSPSFFSFKSGVGKKKHEVAWVNKAGIVATTLQASSLLHSRKWAAG